MQESCLAPAMVSLCLKKAGFNLRTEAISKDRVVEWIDIVPSAAEAALDVVSTAGLKPRPFKTKRRQA
jgi:hypothetical protein